MKQFRATTIVAVRRGSDDVCIAGDGQVTMGETAIMKAGAKKVQKIYKDQVLVGFAGGVADAFSLREKFEKKLEEHSGNLKRAAVALAQDWRMDKVMRNLEALMIVANEEGMLLISGNGEVIEPDADVDVKVQVNGAYADPNTEYQVVSLGATNEVLDGTVTEDAVDYETSVASMDPVYAIVERLIHV